MIYRKCLTLLLLISMVTVSLPAELLTKAEIDLLIEQEQYYQGSEVTILIYDILNACDEEIKIAVEEAQAEIIKDYEPERAGLLEWKRVATEKIKIIKREGNIKFYVGLAVGAIITGTISLFAKGFQK